MSEVAILVIHLELRGVTVSTVWASSPKLRINSTMNAETCEGTCEVVTRRTPVPSSSSDARKARKWGVGKSADFLEMRLERSSRVRTDVAMPARRVHEWGAQLTKCGMWDASVPEF